MTADLRSAALEYAGRGWPVFPLHSPTARGCSCGSAQCGSIGKHPRSANGLKDASTDPAIVKNWWRRWPDANIGIRTGVAFDVLDIDCDDLYDGTADLPEFTIEGGPVVRTGAGWHFYVLPGVSGNRARFGAHADWRGDGGYVVAPPSLHASGRRYEWYAPPTLPLTAAPAELVAAVAHRPAMPPRAATAPPPRSGRSEPATAGLSGIYARVAAATVGERNAVTFWAARAIGLKVYRREITEDVGRGALDNVHATAAGLGLADHEIAATIRSGWSNGIAGESRRSA